MQGSTAVSAQDLTLLATGCVPDQYGLFFYGPATASTPLGAGYLCVDGGGLGLFRLVPATKSDASGVAAKTIDWNAPPVGSGPGVISAGATWNFQYWYRDPASAFNLSNGLSITFCP